MSMVMEMVMVMVMFPDEEGKISGTMMFARRYVPRENGPTCTNHIAILAKLGPATPRNGKTRLLRPQPRMLGS